MTDEFNELGRFPVETESGEQHTMLVGEVCRKLRAEDGSLRFQVLETRKYVLESAPHLTVVRRPDGVFEIHAPGGKVLARHCDS